MTQGKAKHAILLYFPVACPLKRNKVLNFLQSMFKCVTMNLHTSPGFLGLLSVSLAVSVCHFFVFSKVISTPYDTLKLRD